MEIIHCQLSIKKLSSRSPVTKEAEKKCRKVIDVSDNNGDGVVAISTDNAGRVAANELLLEGLQVTPGFVRRLCQRDKRSEIFDFGTGPRMTTSAHELAGLAATRVHGCGGHKCVRSLLLCSFALVLACSFAQAEAQTGVTERAYSCGSLRSMGRVYMASGGYEKAQPFLERALHIAEGASGSDSDLYACMLDLAYLYKSQGKLEEAEKMCLSGLELQEKALHENHPYVAYTLRILSEIYRGQGRYPEAESSLERAISIIHAVRPDDDQQSAPFLVDMARLLVDRGRFADAEVHFEKVIPLIEQSFGPEHLYTTKVLAGMAALYVEQERFAEAQELIVRILPVQEKVYGPDHHLLVPVWLLQARIHRSEMDLARAKSLYDKSLRVVENQPDSGPLTKGEVLIGLGRFHLLSKEYAQAADVLERALNILEGVFDDYHPRIADVLETLAQLRRETGDVAEASRLQQRAKDIRMRQRIDSAPVARVIE